MRRDGVRRSEEVKRGANWQREEMKRKERRREEGNGKGRSGYGRRKGVEESVACARPLRVLRGDKTKWVKGKRERKKGVKGEKRRREGERE